ncbi:MAG: ribokinase, partial [Saccharothrix sp.]|nr:ribokinase [Saccharothrix sp.]
GFLDDIAGVDLLLPNTEELVALTGSPEPASAKSLLDVVGAVALTSGEHGASWVDRAGVLSVPALDVECVDSTGAGDAFDAGLLAAWLAGGSREESLAGGVRAAASAVSHVGAQPVGKN